MYFAMFMLSSNTFNYTILHSWVQDDVVVDDVDDDDADDDVGDDVDADASCCSILHWSALQGPGATGRRGRCCMLPLRNKPPRCNTSSSPSSDHHHNVAWMPGCLDV